METNIDRVRRAVRRSWYDDGICELAAAAVLTVVTLFFAAEALVGRESLPRGFWTFGLVAIVLAGTAAAQITVRALKQRVAHPRAGYVVHRTASARRRVAAALVGGAVNVAFVLLLRGRQDALTWLPLVEGAAVGVFLAYMAASASVTRLYWVAAVALGCGLAGTLARADSAIASALIFGAVSVALALTGGLTLGRFLQDQTPAQSV